MTAAVATVPGTRVAGRWVGLDRLRGLAILLMVADHVALVSGQLDLFRVTGGRLAMPLFFLVSGCLVRWPSPRWALIAVIGALLPVAVPWIDSPNVLVLYVLGACCLALVTRLGLPSWWLAVPALVLMVNGWNVAPGNSFDVFGAVALMALGHWCLPLRTAGQRLPAFLELPGRHPLPIYVGHLLGLQALVLLGVASPTLGV